MFLMPVRTRSAILVLATAIGMAAAGPQTAAGAEAARARPGIRAADLVQRPTGFLHRALRLEDVVVVDRFGGQVFLVRED